MSLRGRKGLMVLVKFGRNIVILPGILSATKSFKTDTTSVHRSTSSCDTFSLCLLPFHYLVAPDSLFFSLYYLRMLDFRWYLSSPSILLISNILLPEPRGLEQSEYTCFLHVPCIRLHTIIAREGGPDVHKA